MEEKNQENLQNESTDHLREQEVPREETPVESVTDIQPEQAEATGEQVAVEPTAEADTTAETAETVNAASGEEETAAHDPHEDGLEHTPPAEDLEEEVLTFEGENPEKMIGELKRVFAEDKVREFRRSFASLKERYKEILEEEKSHALQHFLEEGGIQEDFKYAMTAELHQLRELISNYSDRMADFRKKEEQQQQANYLAKQDILDEMKKLITDEPDIKKAIERFKELKDKWSTIGQVPSAKSTDLWNTYKHYVDSFYEYVKLNRELFEMELKKNLTAKQQLIRRAEGLLKMPSIQKSIELLHAIQKEWRETGPIPRSQSQETFQKFREIVEKVYARRDEFIKDREEERQKNLVAKMELCEAAKKLAEVEYSKLSDWKKADNTMKEYEEKWRTIGRVPQELNDTVWEQFKGSRKELYRRRNALQKQMNSEFETNFQAKVKLCEQAEALVDNTDWKETSQKLIRLQQEWKKIGPVDRKRSDEIWARFRAACDAFFGKKDQHFGSASEREQENLDKKKALVERINAYEPVESLDDNMIYIRDVQKEWAEIGYVPIKEKNAIEKAYDHAIDGLMSKLNIDKDKKHRVEYKMKLEGWMQQNNAYQLLKDERMFVGNRIRKLEEEINQIENNLGFFKHSKGADAMKKQFEDKVDSLRQTLSILEDKRTLLKNAIKTMEK